MRVLIKEKTNGISNIEQLSVDHKNGLTDAVGQVKLEELRQFLRPRDNGKSPLEELVGGKITKENTIFYVCGWQGTIDGVRWTKGFF